MSGRMGGTGASGERDSADQFKVRDTRNLQRGGPQGRPGLTSKQKRAMRHEIRAAARDSRRAQDPRFTHGRRTRGPVRQKRQWELILRVAIGALSAACVLIWLLMQLG